MANEKIPASWARYRRLKKLLKQTGFLWPVKPDQSLKDLADSSAIRERYFFVAQVDPGSEPVTQTQHN